jgi:hypothetical protein
VKTFRRFAGAIAHRLFFNQDFPRGAGFNEIVVLHFSASN